MLNVRKVEVDGCYYLFTERECETIEKYFDSIRLFMDDVIVDEIISNIPYGGEYDVISLVAHYDYYLVENDYDKEDEFSKIMYYEFGIDI